MLYYGSHKLTPQKGTTHRPLSSSFIWFILRILQGNPKKGLLSPSLAIRGLPVDRAARTSSSLALRIRILPGSRTLQVGVYGPKIKYLGSNRG